MCRKRVVLPAPVAPAMRMRAQCCSRAGRGIFESLSAPTHLLQHGLRHRARKIGAHDSLTLLEVVERAEEGAIPRRQPWRSLGRGRGKQGEDRLVIAQLRAEV